MRVWFGLVLLLAAGFAADTQPAGSFAGTWKNDANGDSGALQFTLKNSGSAWSGEVKLVYQGSEVPATVRSVKFASGEFEVVYEANVQGSEVRVSQKGRWNGTEFSGTFVTVLVENGEVVATGPWSAKRKS